MPEDWRYGERRYLPQGTDAVTAREALITLAGIVREYQVSRLRLVASTVEAVDNLTQAMTGD